MIIVRLKGGLGNQMFQYALGRCLSVKLNKPLKLDISFLLDRTSKKETHTFREYDLDIFNVVEDFATKEETKKMSKRAESEWLNKVLNKLVGYKATYLPEPHFHFYSEVFNTSTDLMIDGYWQSEKYFKEIENTLRTDFTFKKELGNKAKELKSEIEKTNSICINIRRGDFVNNPFHDCIGPDYYKAAERIINSKVDNPHYYVFSDDQKWSQENMTFDFPCTFVTDEYAGFKYQDKLRLMSYCKHFIIPNSSFAWWATWLNTNNDKIVVAPKIWFNDPGWNTKDLIPDKWYRV